MLQKFGALFMSETLMMIDPILSTAPVCHGTLLASLSIGWLPTLFDPDLVVPVGGL
jgi:hypothetical protein